MIGQNSSAVRGKFSVPPAVSIAEIEQNKARSKPSVDCIRKSRFILVTHEVSPSHLQDIDR